MEVKTALLCDFAQVREGLLFVSSGGITRMWRDDLPAAMGCYIALVIELDSVERQRPHELQVVVMDEDGERVADATGAFQVQSEAPETETQLVPLTLDLRNVGVKRYGAYSVKYYVDGSSQGELNFRVSPRTSQN